MSILRIQLIFDTEKRFKAELQMAAQMAEAGLHSKAEFAEKIGISKYYLYQIMRGQPVSTNIAYKFSKAINSDVDEYFNKREIGK